MTQCHRVTDRQDGQTDRQTDRRIYDTSTALSVASHADARLKWCSFLGSLCRSSSSRSRPIVYLTALLLSYVLWVMFLQQTRESWQVVFALSASIFTLGGVAYCVLGSGVIQPWALKHLPAPAPASDISLVPKSHPKSSSPSADTN